MKKTFLIALLFSVAAFAATGEHHEEHAAIPYEQIGWQALNLGILLIALFFFLRKSVVEAFQNRRTNFLSQAEKTKAALKNAETALLDARTKLNELEAGEAKSLENALHESNLVKTHIIHDSETQAAKMKNDLPQVLRNELEKAKAEINTLILNQAITSVTKKINSNSGQVSQIAEAAFLSQISQVKS